MDSTTDLLINASWGNKTIQGIMPGKGKYIFRNYTPEETAAFLEQVISLNKLNGCLGEKTVDIFLNDNTLWRNVPQKVWDFHIGGYQVLKKWLSYREGTVIGRPVSTDEAKEFTKTVRRISAILILTEDLNDNYRKSKNE